MRQWITKIVLGPDYKVIRVKSWRPAWGRYGLEWPSMLVDIRGGRRSTVSPVWDRWHFRAIAFRLIGRDTNYFPL